MTVTSKNRIKDALEQAKQQGQLRSEKIKEIVRNAVSESILEVKEGRKDIAALVQNAVAALLETVREEGGEIKEEIAATLEGAVEGVSSARRQLLSKERSEIKQLQSQIDLEEAELQQEIDGALVEVKTVESNRSEKVKEAIESAIDNIRNSEEVALLQKRYAQLKAQLAIIDANLAERYGDRYDEVKHYLDEAKTWYDRAQENPEEFTDRVDRKRVEFESQLSEAGSAVARGERQLKQRLKELWHSITEIFHNK
jgi:metal-responsive CopG/Arc/MetJ family transcriptional regulator